MIGLDTNVLVRVFVEDQPSQTKAAKAFLAQRGPDDPGYASMIVIAELVWVLHKAYGFERPAVVQFIDWLLESTNIVVEQHELVQSALILAEANNTDICDALIAGLATMAGATGTVTFDRVAARRIPGMELLK